MTTYANFTAEGGHWYDKDARQIETVTGSKGKEVKPDIRHARKLQLAPGVTTIIKQADRPQLAAWKERQAVMAALTLPRERNESDSDFVKRIFKDSKEQAELARDKGTIVHAEIQRAIEAGRVSGTPLLDSVGAHLGMFDFKSLSTEASCVSVMGYGTKCDIMGWSRSLGGPVVIDFKTKDELKEEITLYDEHDMQLAATRHAVADHLDQMYRGAKCYIMFIARDLNDCGEVPTLLVESEESALRRGMRMFASLLRYWQHKNRYAPDWSEGIHGL